MSAEPITPQKAPYPIDVEEGKNYHWCACGRSDSQPFCDGSHQGTGIEPVSHTAEKSEAVYFCGCKKTSSPPMCDGTHKSL